VIFWLGFKDVAGKTWHTLSMTEELPRQNPFLALKFYEFAAVSMLVLAFFPLSFLVCWVAFGTQTTRDLVEAMIKDWVQTMLILAGLIAVLFGGLIWGLIEWLA
jgi:hypothetical protein